MIESKPTLESIFNDNCKTCFKKIHEGIDYKLDREFAKVNLIEIMKKIDSFESRLWEYYPQKDVELVNLILQEISYPLSQLKLLLKGSKRINKKTAHIFTYFVYHKMEELKVMAKEIDKTMQ